MVDVFGFEVEDQSWKCGCLLSRATVDWLPSLPPECLRLVRPNWLPRAARAGLSQLKPGRPSFDTQLLVHAGALFTTARADSVVLLLVLVCFVKARPLTPYQAAALGNLAGSVLPRAVQSCTLQCLLLLACLPRPPGPSWQPGSAHPGSACKEELLC